MGPYRRQGWGASWRPAQSDDGQNRRGSLKVVQEGDGTGGWGSEGSRRNDAQGRGEVYRGPGDDHVIGGGECQRGIGALDDLGNLRGGAGHEVAVSEVNSEDRM